MKRRDFIRTASVLAAGTAAAPKLVFGNELSSGTAPAVADLEET
jgi:hypothetical protein